MHLTDQKKQPSEDEIPMLPQIEQLKPYNRFWLLVFFTRRFVLVAVNLALCAYLIYESYSSCTTYFIASTYSIVVPRYLILPLAILSTAACLVAAIGTYINYYHLYKYLKNDGLTKWSQIAPHFDKLKNTCSYADASTACPLFEMINLTKFSGNIVSSPYSSFDHSYYFSPVYAAYRADGKSTESLLFELQDFNQQLYCGNYGKLFPDNIHVSVANLSNAMSTNNTWEALSSYLKNVHVLEKLDQAIMYTVYQDSTTNNTYVALSSIKISTQYICTLT
ncbi:hypothetical protein HDV04_003864 [Boothiomyces sp. JEL0838]|nr:hypothetical protein HDV04_003864 [Boothiomyces sp. JEL0838]